uniref:Cytochrome c biogenesis C n=1 Tax=Vaccinium macrocarpon TaxID=13750 RepID=V9PBU8_VACMA|nr:cytochrome c biogenesis C [Vaccinium macrocarpon]AGX28809.1 cytochrome c biogenesis C [Vaccinium macrocarpon]
MSVSLSQPYFLMSKTRSYAQILIGSRLFLTAMAIHLSLRVAPLDLQQGGNSRIPYVHVPAARMTILVYIATAINTFVFLLTKHPLFLRFFGTGTEIGVFSTFFTLVTGGFRGRPMWGTFWVWDARLTSVFISFLIYVGHLLGVGCSFNLCIHLVPYLPGGTAFSKASCRTGSYFNPCWTDRYTNNKVFSQLVEYIASTWDH